MNAVDQSLRDNETVGFLFEYEGASQLGLKLLQVVVSVVPHLITDPDDHELELINLANRLYSRWCLLHSSSLCCKSTWLLPVLFGHIDGLNLSFNHLFVNLCLQKSVFLV